jgi:hypothetical protein
MSASLSDHSSALREIGLDLLYEARASQICMLRCSVDLLSDCMHGDPVGAAAAVYLYLS